MSACTTDSIVLHPDPEIPVGPLLPGYSKTGLGQPGRRPVLLPYEHRSLG